MDLCAEIERENREALMALDAHAQQVALAGFSGAVRSSLACAKTAEGAWGLTLSGLSFTDDWVRGRWALIHIDSSGRRATMSSDAALSSGQQPRAPGAPSYDLEWSQETHMVPSAPVTFDYDGDGISEAIVLVGTETFQESGLSFHSSEGQIWTVRGQAIVLYPPARELVVEEVRDVDGDGRPDVLTHEPYAGTAIIRCGSEDPYPVLGPMLLAHALPAGGFSRADAAAQAFAQRECEPRSNEVLVDQQGYPGFVHQVTSAKNVACARLRGADSKMLLSQIAARCHEQETCPTCDNPALLERWATIEPPLRIP